MKKQIKKTVGALFSFILTATLIFTACKKETGPKGDTGATGPQGPAGNANVQSFTITTTNGSWTFDAADFSWYSDISASQITSNVMEKGTVQAFIKGTDNSWIAMPFTSSLGDAFIYSVNLNKVRVYYHDATTTPGNPGGQTFKVVIIPPAMMKPNVNYRNYEELKSAYSIAD